MDLKRTENIYDERQKESDRINVVLLCDEWKSSKGGLSTFNRELAINLANTTTNNSMKIHCYVSKSDDRDRQDAEKHNVNLITAKKIPGSMDPLDCLKLPPPGIRIDVVVSHGRKFGVPAYFIVQITNCKWIQFLHVCCEDLGKYKNQERSGEDSIQDNENKHRCELELCKAADAVVGVGRELQAKYKSYLPDIDVQILTPGIFESFNQPVRHGSRSVGEDSQVFNVFVFGRVNFEDLAVKGLDIISETVASLGRRFKLTCVGSPPGQQKEFETWFLEKTGIARDQLTIRRYCNQDEVKGMFREADLVALPSRVEGFGLIAVEAISAGVSVLISRQSGISTALRKVQGGNSVIVNSEKPEEWANRIQEMSLQAPQQRCKNARRLRENYGKTYSWESECNRFKNLIDKVLNGMCIN